MTGPWTAIEPSVANAYSSGFETWNERWVRRRWKPTVTPSPVSTYITPRITRSVADTALFHSNTIAARKATKGRATAATFTRFSNLVIHEVFPSPADISTLLRVEFDSGFTHVSDKKLSREPWRSLPADIADVIEPELEATTDEILATIAREVPGYARPLEGSFGRGVRTGVTEALRQFVELIRSPSGARGPGREVYVALGSGELRQGRTLDALQSAYRVGARVAWRRLAAAATRAGVEPDVLSLLAESIFAYIETLSADSVDGYAEARSQLEGERRRRRHELVAALVREPPTDEADLRAAAEAVAWRRPRPAAALACDEEQLERVATRLPADALAAGLDGVGCAIVPDPDGPGRPSQIERAIGTAGMGAHAVLGP